MDELFDRIKALKIKRKYLVISLIFSELLGILVLLWFLRIPLIEKFSPPPKAYSVVSLSPQKRYLVSQSDYLTGNAIPNTTVKVLIIPGKIKDSLTSDSKGEWSYRIPPGLEKGIYLFSFGNFDKSNKLVTFQSYKFRITTGISLFKLNDSLKSKLSLTNPEEVYAQESLNSNYYSNFSLPAPNNPIQLTNGERHRFEKYFLPYAYSAAQIKDVDWRLMSMWVLSEDNMTNYMDNCLDGNKGYGEDADLNQNTTCTGWVNSQLGVAPNWEVGWAIFPWQGIDHLTEAIAVMRPGESLQQIGQRVINESRDEDRYNNDSGIVFFKPPNDPITNPKIFPGNVTLEEIIEGAKPLGQDKDRSRTCRPDDKAHADPNQDPKDCQMRQLLGILMKDPAISAYLLAHMWKETINRGNLAATLQGWGPPGKNPYRDLQKVSNIIAGINRTASDWDLEALKATPTIVMPVATTVQDPVYPIDGVQVETVVSQNGHALDNKDLDNKNLVVTKIVIPAGTNPQDFICTDPEKCQKQPNPNNNVKGVSNIGNVSIDTQVAAMPQDYQLCVLLKPIDFDVIISSSCISMEQIIDPSIVTDNSLVTQPNPISENPLTPTEFTEETKTTPQPDGQICDPSEWSDRQTGGDFICRGDQACFKKWQANPANNCNGEDTGNEDCDFDQRCADIQNAAEPGTPEQPLETTPDQDEQQI